MTKKKLISNNNSQKRRGFGSSASRGSRSSSQSLGSKNAKTRIVNQGEQITPDSAEIVLNYGDSFDFSAAGLYNVWQFRMNSPNDPDYTFTGYQPTGWDQWTALYSQYRVSKAEISVSISPTTKPVVLVFFSAPNVTVPTTIDLALTQRNSKHVLCGVYETKKITRTINMPEFFGVDKEEFGDISLFGASVGSNPAAVCYGTAMMFNADNTSVVGCNFTATLRLYIQMISPIYLTLSSLAHRPEQQVEKPFDQITSKVCKSIRPSESYGGHEALGDERTIKPSQRSELLKVNEPSVVTLPSGLKPRRTAKQILAEFDLVD